MSTLIPDSYRDLLDGPVLVTLVTLLPDGQPHASPVWCNYDGTHILLNTTRGRQKEKNMKARPQATVLAVDPTDPYRYLEVRGRIVEMTEEGGVEHISQLAKLYAGAESYYGDFAPAERRLTETRVVCKLVPTKVVAHG
ncbi:MAG: PPOX class F420-dependent oxidoreductase [Anaerolineae bacterium]|nr:PPOX class F420-dependent oxidoreductase [Anaerolineae bacterium]